MEKQDYKKLEKNLGDLKKQVDSFYDEFNQHEHTGIDSKQVAQNSLGGFISQIDTYNNATQAVSSGSETLVQFNTENYDSGQEFDTTTHLFTAKTSGMYLVTTGVTYETSSSAVANKTLGLRIKKSGTLFYEAFLPATDNAVTDPKLTVGITQIMKLVDGDTIGIYAYQDTGGSKNIVNGRENNFLSIKRLPNV